MGVVLCDGQPRSTTTSRVAPKVGRRAPCLRCSCLPPEEAVHAGGRSRHRDRKQSHVAVRPVRPERSDWRLRGREPGCRQPPRRCRATRSLDSRHRIYCGQLIVVTAGVLSFSSGHHRHQRVTFSRLRRVVRPSPSPRRCPPFFVWPLLTKLLGIFQCPRQWPKCLASLTNC